MAQWVGYTVSVVCSDNKGTFQGEILSVTDSKLTLTKAFCNGIPSDTSELIIHVGDIADLKLIEKQSSPTGQSTITVAKPVPKRATRTTNTENSQLVENGVYPVKSKPIDITPKTHYEASMKGTPGRGRERGRGRLSESWKDEACFGSPLGDAIAKDFDFEKMLALFDKQAVRDEINSRMAGKHKKPTKFRHDENIISAGPTSLRQIVVPSEGLDHEGAREYVTDDGLVVPSVSRALRAQLFLAAEREGVTWERRSELTGRAATEMALQLLGGGHRLHPNNVHQVPTVVFLCGQNRQGSVGMNAARQLASHGVNTIVYVPTTKSNCTKRELALYKLTRNRVVTNPALLPDAADLIVVALCDDSDNSKRAPPNMALTYWTAKSRASVLAIDPPASGTPGIPAKYSLAPALPLSHCADNGKIYLCNLGIPVELFAEVRIEYKSPFGSKFVIPLHPNDDVTGDK